MKKLIGGLAIAAAVLCLVGAPAAASATTPPPAECVPSEAWTEYIEHPAVGEPTVTIDNPDYQPGTDASTTWWNFAPNKDQGPLEGAPLFPLDERGTWEGPHTEGGPGQDQEGVYQQGGGYGSWFYRETIPGTDPVGDPTIEVPNPDYVAPWVEEIEHDAVTCDPEEPTTYTPSCTTVLDSYVIEGDGVISVAGGWESETISVPLAGVVTLADIGTVLDIQADPLQYVGLHIRTDEGSITFEEEPSYGGDLWSTSEWEGVEAGMGYAAFGSIEEYIELNGDVVVNAIDLLYTHPEASTTTVESFIIGCTLYTFEPPVIVPEQPEDIVVVTEETFVNCDADTFTTVTTTTTTSTVYDAQTNTWVPTEPVVQIASSEREATDAECPPAPVEPEKPSTPVDEPVDEAPAPTAQRLAETGGPDMTGLAFGAFGVLAIGIAAALAARVRRQH
jgi:hypothetical protein